MSTQTITNKETKIGSVVTMEIFSFSGMRSPLGNSIEFHELKTDSNDLGLSWHEWIVTESNLCTRTKIWD